MGWTRRTGLVVGLVMLLGACWPAPGAGPDRSGYNAVERGFDAGSVASFTELWTATTDGTGPRGVSHPIVGDGAVFAGTSHSVYAFDEVTGAPRWARTPDTATYDEVDTELFFFNGNVFTSLRRGEHNWEPAQFAAATGSWFTAEMNGRMEGVRGRGGVPTVLLSQFAPIPTGGTAQSAFLFGGSGSSQPTLLTESPNATRLTLGTDRYFHLGAGGPHGAVLQAVATSAPGARLWTAELSGRTYTTPTLGNDGRTVFVATDGSVDAVDTATGALRWSTDIETPITAPLAVAGDVIYVPTGYGVRAMSATDGSTLWSAFSEPQGRFEEVHGQPAVAGGVVFIGTYSGRVVAFPADGCGLQLCSPLWSDTTGSPITGAPAVTNGRLFVGTEDGRVIAYGLPPA